MPSFIRAANANDAWLRARELLRTSEERSVVASRVGDTTEMLHVTLSIDNPRERWIPARQPAISPAFALAEAIWILAGRNDAAVLNFFNRDLCEYSGKGSEFYGAYGYRLRHQHGIDQLEAAYRALQSNPGTRQIVLQIWDAKADIPIASGLPRDPDIPCNTQSMLRIQNGKLHWLQTMRSNDLFRGLPYNLVQFTTLHEVIAGWLGMELGTYTHVVNSLHFYHSDAEKLDTVSDVRPAPNDESLMLSWEAGENIWRFLSELITRVNVSAFEVSVMSREMESRRMPIPHANAGNVVLAEAARRHGDLDLAHSHIAKVTNPALRQLWDAWFDRVA